MLLQLGVNFAPKSKEKQKQSLSAAIFSQPNSNEDKKNNQIFTPVCAIFIRLIEMKTNAKRFCLTILLFVVLLCDICFCATFDRHIQIKTKQIKKKVFPAYPVWGDAKFWIRGSQILMGGR